MKALTFKISFFTAHFKHHRSKRFRDTYLIPLPSTIAGIIGAILGVRRKELREWSEKNNLLCGAKLIDYGGVFNEYAILLKYDNFTNITRTPDIVRILIEPEYIVAVAGEDHIINKLYERLISLKFEFPIYGGSDYHFLKYIGDPKEGELTKGNIGEGYLEQEKLSRVTTNNKNKLEVQVSYVRGNVRKNFVFVYGGMINSKVEHSVVTDNENSIFVFEAHPFISI